MPHLSVTFLLHLPLPLENYSFFDIGRHKAYFRSPDKAGLQLIQQSIIALKHICAALKKGSVGLYCSGVVLETMQQYSAESLADLKKLVKEKKVVLLGGTFSHSPASLYDIDIFTTQVYEHAMHMKTIFGKTAKTFANTSLLWKDALIGALSTRAFQGVLTEGLRWHLNGRSPNYIYLSNHSGMDIKMLMNNAEWSAIFTQAKETGDTTFEQLIKSTAGQLINVVLNMEQLNTGFAGFWQKAMNAIALSKIELIDVTSALDKFEAVGRINVMEPVMQNLERRKMWLIQPNALQQEALRILLTLKPLAAACPTSLQKTYALLQQAEYFENMYTGPEIGKQQENEAYQAYIHYLNILADFELSLARHKEQATQKT